MVHGFRMASVMSITLLFFDKKISISFIDKSIQMSDAVVDQRLLLRNPNKLFVYLN